MTGGAGLALAGLVLLLGGCAADRTPSSNPSSDSVRGGASPTLSDWPSDGRFVMGTVLEITLELRADREARSALEQAFARVAELDALLSRYEPESDVSRVNAAAGEIVSVDPRVSEILRFSRDAARDTRGVFDITIGPLVALWVAAARSDRPPSEGELRGALALVGAERILIESEHRVGLRDVGMSIDLGGVAKGFALDSIVAEFRRDGFGAGLLSFGQSSVWALGAPPGDSGWRLLLRSPMAADHGANGSGFAGLIELRDLAFSVSSTLGQWSEIGGRRYGHVIDPRDGIALDYGRQAAVVADSAALAEVLSTALVILSAEEGLALIAAMGAEAFVVDEQGQSWQSPGWQATTKFEPIEDWK